MTERRPIFYRLDGHTPVACWDFLDAENELTSFHRVVACDTIGPAMISTIFLAVDHNTGLFGDEAPILFETKIFGLPRFNRERTQWRYHTWDEAAAGHQDAVALVRSLIPDVTE